MRPNSDLRAVIEARIERVPESGCWIWMASLVQKVGYGQLTSLGKNWRAHRAAWVAYNGPIPEGMMVCHRCDVRECVNPAHLFLGTSRDNIDDMMAKGRQARPRGEIHGHAKLTEAQVREIRSANGSQREIASRFGVSQQHVCGIRSRRFWPHVV